MNRRSFLKLTALTTIGLPSLSIAKEKPRWISLTERLPRVGQKIIVTMHETTYTSIRGGIVREIKGYSSFNSKFSTLRMLYDFYKSDFEDHSIYLIYSDEGEQAIKSRKWLIKNRGYVSVKNFRKFWMKDRGGCLRRTCFFWLPVDGDYPTYIPPIPKDEFIQPTPDEYLAHTYGDMYHE